MTEQPSVKGMSHMVITPQEKNQKEPVDAATKTKQKYTPTQPEQKQQDTPPPVTKKPLSVKDALVKPEDLKTWDKLSLAATAQNKKDVADLLYILDHDRGEIPPQGLFFAAQSLARAGDMEHAAIYCLAGQLRLEFDIARWPAQPDRAYEERKNINAKKTEDQAQPVTKSPALKSPHEHIMSLSSTVSVPVFEWLLKDPKRLATALDKAENWDLSAPYAYDPGYELPAPVPFEEWTKLLPQTRATYFSRMRNLQHNLEKYIGKK